jgi:xanthine dehydrogenase YagR molybdenum-binding subunit
VPNDIAAPARADATSTTITLNGRPVSVDVTPWTRTRIVNAVAAGRIINPKTARSQIIGGVVFGMGMALYEESMTDHQLGRFMNHNLAEYHIASNADVPEIEVIFVDESDPSNTMGVKGLGEIGIVATPAANAIHHATGKRVRDLPITIDKVLSA